VLTFSNQYNTRILSSRNLLTVTRINQINWYLDKKNSKFNRKVRRKKKFVHDWFKI